MIKQRPQTIKEVIQLELEQVHKKEQDHFNLLKSSFAENCCLVYASASRETEPDAATLLAKLIELMENEINELKAGKTRGPGNLCTWQLILPLALTYPTEKYDYSETDKDDDPQCFSEILASGEKVYIKAWNEQHPLSTTIHKIQDLTRNYLETGFKLVKSKQSKSEDLWAHALGIFKRVNHAFRLNKNRMLVDQMAQTMVEASSRLAIDLSFNSSKTATDGNAENTIVGKFANNAEAIVSTITTTINRSTKELKAHVTAETDREIAASSDQSTKSPVKIGEGFPFITYCDPKAEILRMKIRLASGEEDEHPFKIKGKIRWHYVLQFVKANKSRISLKPYIKGESIKLSLIFRDNKGFNHSQFHKFIHATRGSKAQYWLEQTQVQKRTK